jgi:hypothetical protein
VTDPATVLWLAPGDWAEWAGAAATAGAVWFAAISVHRANKANEDARESLAWSEAHLVDITTVGRPPMVWVDMANAGSRAVFDADIVVTAHIGGEVVSEHHWPTVPPSRKQRQYGFLLRQDSGWVGNTPVVDVEVTFTDVGQRRWKMADDGTLTRLMPSRTRRWKRRRRRELDALTGASAPRGS